MFLLKEFSLLCNCWLLAKQLGVMFSSSVLCEQHVKELSLHVTHKSLIELTFNRHWEDVNNVQLVRSEGLDECGRSGAPKYLVSNLEIHPSFCHDNDLLFK